MSKSFLFGIVLIILHTLALGKSDNLDCNYDGYDGKVVLVDKNCIDGKYITEEKEQFLEPNEFPSIQDLVSAFDENNYMAYIYGILERRYPTGKSIIEQGGGQTAVDKWLWGSTSLSSIMRSLGTVIHEIGHGLDQQTPQNWYFISLDPAGNPLSFTTPGMHGKKTTSSSPMYSIERSLVLADDQNYKRPPAQSSKIVTSKEFGQGPFGCDKSYAEIYLCGDPTDSKFDSGDQGFNSLIEEYVQYINSLAYAYYFQDYFRPSSHRHAMLTWMWWCQRYLRKIRTEHPDQYDYLYQNKVWLELILTLWGRAWMYLRTKYPGMQPDTDYLHQLVQEPDMLAEIQRIRDACDCDNPEELLPDQTENIEKENLAEGNPHNTHYTGYNPFQNSISIVVSVNQKANGQLTIFNSSGQKIQTLFSGCSDKGTCQFLWDGRDQYGKDTGSGIYFYIVKVGDIREKGKMIKYFK